MKSFRYVLAAAVAASIPVIGFAQIATPRNSYLDTRVNSTAELIREVRSNTSVADRYKRHFAMTGDAVIDYLSKLRVSKLTRDGVYTVYGVPHSSGDFHAHLRLLKLGEPVFVDSSGMPVLMLVCGNPLVLGPQKPAIANSVRIGTAAPEPVRDVAVDAAPEQSAVTTVDEMPSLSQVQPTYTISPINPTPPSSEPTGLRGISPILIGLPGALQVFENGHGAKPVPEPLSLVVFSAGLAALAARRRLRSSKARARSD